MTAFDPALLGSMTHIFRQNRILFFWSALIVLIASGCTSNKHLKDGEYFLFDNKTRIKSSERVKNKGVLVAELEELYKQKETQTFFGVPRHWFYYQTANNPDSSWFKSYIRKKIANPPVIYDSLKTISTVGLMQRYLRQRGYLNAEVAERTRFDDRKATVLYTADPNKRWTIESVEFVSQDTAIQRILDETAAESFLQPGQPVDIELYNQERTRITRELQNRGYANFFQNFISPLQADSADYRMKLTLEIREPADGSRHTRFTIGKISVFMDYTGSDARILQDTTINAVRYLSQQRKFFVKPDVIGKNLFLRSGEQFKRENLEKTYTQIGRLDAYRFVSIKPINDTLQNDLLHYQVYLTRNKKLSIGGDFELNYSTLSLSQRSLIGTAVNLSYQDRNLFDGGEVYNLNLEGGLELNLNRSSSDTSSFNSWNINLQNDLFTPKYIDPIGFYGFLHKFKIGKQGIISDRFFQWLQEGNTRVSVGASFVNLIDFYRFQTINVSLGYDIRPNLRQRYILNHIGLDYFNPTTEPAFEAILAENRFLRESFGKQLFTGFLFSDFSIVNNGLPDARNLTFSSIFNFELSGLEIFAANSLANVISGSSGTWELGTDNPTQFSQYARFDFDLRWNKQLNNSQSLAFRFASGLAFPYGPFSSQVPYVKQYYVGGPVSIRAWQVRELGPGGFEDLDRDPNSNQPFYQTGDFRIEASMEYRFDLAWIFEGALFLDVGNVWTLKDDPDRPEANITTNFLDQLAVGTGFGMRMDFKYFLLRLDFGYKIRNPYPLNGENWLWSNFSDFSLRQFNTNFAIGYPF